jgi:hypothetical protein
MRVLARWSIRFDESALGVPKVVIEYAGRPFADIYPTHAHAQGPGLQIVSDRLDFTKGVVANPGTGPQPFVALTAGDYQEVPTGPLSWIAFQAKP